VVGGTVVVEGGTVVVVVVVDVDVVVVVAGGSVEGGAVSGTGPSVVAGEVSLPPEQATTANTRITSGPPRLMGAQ